jgi:hypothetical protein
VVSSDVKDVECYDAVTNRWTTKAAMPSPPQRATCVVVDDGIIVMGMMIYHRIMVVSLRVGY